MQKIHDSVVNISRPIWRDSFQAGSFSAAQSSWLQFKMWLRLIQAVQNLFSGLGYYDYRHVYVFMRLESRRNYQPIITSSLFSKTKPDPLVFIFINEQMKWRWSKARGGRIWWIIHNMLIPIYYMQRDYSDIYLFLFLKGSLQGWNEEN